MMSSLRSMSARIARLPTRVAFMVAVVVMAMADTSFWMVLAVMLLVVLLIKRMVFRVEVVGGWVDRRSQPVGG